jgi:hypothetical protein
VRWRLPIGTASKGRQMRGPHLKSNMTLPRQRGCYLRASLALAQLICYPVGQDMRVGQACLPGALVSEPLVSPSGIDPDSQA